MMNKRKRKKHFFPSIHVHHDQHYINTSHLSSILHSSMLDLQSNLNKVRYKIHSPNKRERVHLDIFQRRDNQWDHIHPSSYIVHFIQPVGWLFFHPTQRNSTCWKCRIIHEGLFYNSYLRTWIVYLTGGCDPFVFSTRTEFLCTRARESFLQHIFYRFILFLLFSTTSKVIIINSSLCPDFSNNLADQGDLVVVIVVQYPQHVYKTNVLSNSHPCFRRPNRCCCRT